MRAAHGLDGCWALLLSIPPRFPPHPLLRVPSGWSWSRRRAARRCRSLRSPRSSTWSSRRARALSRHGNDQVRRAAPTCPLRRFHAPIAPLPRAHRAPTLTVPALTVVAPSPPSSSSLCPFVPLPLPHSPTAGEPGVAPADNLHVWRLADGVQVASFYQRSQTNWAPQWTDDEARMARQVTNEVQVYDGHDPSTGIVQRVRLEGVTMLWTAPGPAPHKFAAFTPEKKVRGAPRSLRVRPHKPLTSSPPVGRRRAQAAPANVRIYNYDAPQAPVSQKTFFKAEKVSVYWNKPGTGPPTPSLSTASRWAGTECGRGGRALHRDARAGPDADRGRHDRQVVLWRDEPVLSRRPGQARLPRHARSVGRLPRLRVPSSRSTGRSKGDLTDKEGPVHDVAWSPNGREFVVVYGCTSKRHRRG